MTSKKIHPLLLAVILGVPWGLLANTHRGLCTTDSSAPGLPRAICSFPSCPTGGDCLPPTIEKTLPSIEYQEPLLRWQDGCTGQGISGPCWEVFIDFRFRLAATDSAGVSHIGVHMMHEVNAQRFFKRYWGAATTKDSAGRYEMSGSMTAYVPPGQRLEIGVYEICARDRNGNEGCTLPAKARNLNWSMSSSEKTSR